MKPFLVRWVQTTRVVLLVAFVISCGGGSSPRSTAEGYLSALANLDFPGAAQFVTEDGRSNFESLRNVYSGLTPEEKKKFKVADWVVTGETVTGDIATIDFTFDVVKRGQLSLRRIDGLWKVDQRRTF